MCKFSKGISLCILYTYYKVAIEAIHSIIGISNNRMNSYLIFQLEWWCSFRLTYTTVKREFHLIGVAELKTLYGRPIKVYCKERTICDIVRNRNNMDVAILNEGIKRYLYNFV
ncbi:MAG: hypothetical protein ACI8WT_004697 [Clostridium sp.]|jgi:hypothetical protein